MMQEEPKPGDRDANALAAALCLTLGLRHTEGRMLARLLARDYCTKEELRAAASDDKGAIAISSTDVFIAALRKKLARHDVRISTIPTLGYGLDRTARDKIRRLLARHDRAIRPLVQSGAVEMSE